MKRTLRKIAGSGAAVSLALLCLHSEARAHGCSSASAWQGISSNILELSCFTGCHGGSGNGGMVVSINTEDGWYAALVDRAPVNTAASGVGKLRVDPSRAWNSYVVDKLMGDVKFGEGNPMPNLSTGYVYQCPGGVEKIKAWILAGAPECGAVDGDPSPDPALVVCDLNQPALSPPAAPSDGVQLVGTPFTVDRPARGGKQVTTLPVGTAPTCDDAGSQALSVPPQSYGATSGVWLPTALAGSARVGIWADPRALETALFNAEGQTLADGSPVAQGYTDLAGGPITYGCIHANGWVPNGVASVGSNGSTWMLNCLTAPVDLSSPLKWGCEATRFVPPRLLGLPGARPATFRARYGDS